MHFIAIRSLWIWSIVPTSIQKIYNRKTFFIFEKYVGANNALFSLCHCALLPFTGTHTYTTQASVTLRHGNWAKCMGSKHITIPTCTFMFYRSRNSHRGQESNRKTSQAPHYPILDLFCRLFLSIRFVGAHKLTITNCRFALYLFAFDVRSMNGTLLCVKKNVWPVSLIIDVSLTWGLCMCVKSATEPRNKSESNCLFQTRMKRAHNDNEQAEIL